MKSIFLAAVLLICFTSYSQSVTIVRDTMLGKKMALILSNDSIVQAGTLLKCGRGTLPNGDFKYIHTSGSSAIAILSQRSNGTNDAIFPLGRGFSGLNLEIKSIKKYGNQKRGFKYYIKAGGGNIVNYDLELQDALAVNEIIY